MVQDAEKLHEMRLDKLVGWRTSSQACWLMSSVEYWPSNEEGPSLRQGEGSVGESRPAPLSSFSPASTALRSDSPPRAPTLSCLGEPAFFTPETKSCSLFNNQYNCQSVLGAHDNPKDYIRFVLRKVPKSHNNFYKSILILISNLNLFYASYEVI